ncbi:hypothetical protein [Jidongwangia harbinensis]|uniref:hypothetical protein n=1 Tax=Jidongwangia harbinensis TaxID=2878561 RepID=UPI001CD99D7F|nr:hypothetical protein [Jidongwangia harbinensis]MCA2216278.1 hypothetical protein [Jidongwangia harbinensis]MCA2217013.1 hypothetical protein [Jidongwangia harbinensis]
MKRARYQISINGFDVKNQSWDHALQVDGKDDEVFIGWNSKKMRSDGTLIYEAATRKSATIGDVNGQSGRVVGGSASSKGGLRDGDRYPHDKPWMKKRVFDLPAIPPFIWSPTRIEISPEVPSGRDYPPMNCFTDTITEGEVVYFTPSIWEFDLGQSAWEGMLAWLRDTDDKFGARAKEIFTKVFPPNNWIFDAVSLGIQTASTLTSITGSSGSRPIGTVRSATNPATFVFNPWILELTFERAEALIAAEPAGVGHGVLAIPYTDDISLRGSYQLYLQVERLGPVEG